MTVFDEHTERLEAEAFEARWRALMKEQKRLAARHNEKQLQRWKKSLRRRLAVRLFGLAERLDTDPPKPVDWKSFKW